MKQDKEQLEFIKRHQDKIDAFYRDDDGYWCYLKKGFYFIETQTGVSREDDFEIMKEQILNIKNEV